MLSPDGSLSARGCGCRTDGGARADMWFLRACAFAYGLERILQALAARPDGDRAIKSRKLVRKREGFCA
ncbi:hypothetical protein MPNT_310018 [Candidatus Methylacidithermus pantelleriae]|uniref:Uncharacterized protein n=1 Tax=Candidatus Methylacidithermus pantelleriae TaxID=2744239 RepID=A0A8J2BMQ2_9BACT|nr:hypothetical protein MPNT_310018 [Candidatus Methylacidithermus pantelleriae]